MLQILNSIVSFDPLIGRLVECVECGPVSRLVVVVGVGVGIVVAVVVVGVGIVVAVVEECAPDCVKIGLYSSGSEEFRFTNVGSFRQL